MCSFTKSVIELELGYDQPHYASLIHLAPCATKASSHASRSATPASAFSRHVRAVADWMGTRSKRVGSSWKVLMEWFSITIMFFLIGWSPREKLSSLT